jgi:methylmalonyl-CoA/ethylmalonyl-CoA epimerase
MRRPGSIESCPSGVDHIGVLTEDFGVVRSLFGDLLGLDVGDPVEDEELGLAFLWVELGGVRFEFIRPLDQRSTGAKRLRARGPGLDHVALRVADVGAALDQLREAGVETADQVPRAGAGGTRIAFLALDAAAGTRVELVEHPVLEAHE